MQDSTLQSWKGIPWRSLLAMAMLALVSGCAVSPPETAPAPEAVPEPEPEIPIISSVPETPPPAIAIEPPKVTIVMASRSPAYEDVAVAIPVELAG